MNIHRIISPGFTLLLALLFTAPLAYAATPDEQQLQNEQQGIDAAAKSTAPRAEALAAEFGVATETVTSLRNQKRGWGTITIELAMAKQITTANPAGYLDMATALARIEAMRTQGLGWGRIAQDLGFKLGPVVSAVQRARHNAMHAARPPAPASAARDAKPERDDHGRPERPDRLDRPNRPDRPDRPGRP